MSLCDNSSDRFIDDSYKNEVPHSLNPELPYQRLIRNVLRFAITIVIRCYYTGHRLSIFTGEIAMKAAGDSRSPRNN